MAAVMRLRPDARKLWFSNVRSRISPWRWKNTARRSALLASPLLRPAWLRWRNTGSDNHCSVNRVRSIRPSARSARDRRLPAAHEAADYVRECGAAWRKTPGAVEWLTTAIAGVGQTKRRASKAAH